MLTKQAVRDAVHFCLDRYVEIYYFFPLLQERTVKGVKLDREVYAVIWLCDNLIKEQNHGYCLQQDVHKVFRWWRPPYHTKPRAKEGPDSHFTKLLNMLEDAGYVSKVVHKQNRRTKEIRITRKGYDLLENIKGQRERSIQSLFKLVQTREQLDQVKQTVGAIANYTWKTMKTYKKPSWAEAPPPNDSSKSKSTKKRHNS